MGNNEDGKSKSEKSSSPVPQDQTNFQVYSDWAAMQAYYGPRMPMPPYYNSAVAPGHPPPPYMWSPAQPMMPPYGAPYATIYPGGVYAHPGVPLGSHPPGHGFPPTPVDATPLAIETPKKVSTNSEQGLMKKLKGFDGLAMSIGNGTAKKVDRAAEHILSLSADTEGSSDGSDGNTTGMDQTRRKRGREGTPTVGGDGKTEAKSVPSGDDVSSDKMLNVTNPPVKAMVPHLSPGTGTDLELGNPPARTPQPCGGLPSEAWLQNERELKRERRKQSNRESARRSRLRKQAETEELARKVESLTAENMALKSEINQLTEKSENLKLENATLVEKMKNVQSGETVEFLSKSDSKRAPPVSTENLLSRVSNSGSDERNTEDREMYEKKPKSGAKLHQLLDTSPRADAVAAG